MASGIQGFQNLSALPVLRQVGLLLALAASVALGVYVALWSKTPEFVPLFSEYTDMSQSTRADAVSVLQLHNIPFQIEINSGLLLVDASRLYEARMQLSQDGVSLHDAEGFDLLDKEGSFGESQFIEQTKYTRALQGELSKTISSIRAVRRARVHLAIPKASPFLRGQNTPSASVFLELQGSGYLEFGQIQGIVNLVASSVPGMQQDDVTVVDQYGHLLSAPGSDPMSVAGRHMEYQQSLENVYSRRIEKLLNPILGPGRVRAEVSALMDFTEQEQSQEQYDPKTPVLRSEQISDENKTKSAENGVGGVAASSVSTPTNGQGSGEEAKGLQRHAATRQYDVSREISYTKKSVGEVKRLSVAVLVDDRQETAADGTVKRSPLTKEEINKITSLVKEAIGFDDKRGDVVTVINSSFVQEPPLPPENPVPLYEKPWFNSAVKQGIGVLIVLLLLFVILKPAFKQLMNLPLRPPESAARGSGGGNPDQYQKHVGAMIDNDPKKVAQVMMDWIGTDEE